MKDYIAKSIFLFIDIVIIALSIYIAYAIRVNFFDFDLTILPLSDYLKLYPIYIITILLFLYEGIYTSRYDFWHESRLIIKAIFFSMILTFAYLAMTKSSIFYSRLLIGFTFIIMAIFIPVFKIIIKNLLYKIGLWQKEAIIYGDDNFLSSEIYENKYLGYIKPKNQKNVKTIFINSKDKNLKNLNDIILKEMKKRHEVIFIPIIDNYNLTNSTIYQLFNTRTNLIVFKNRLKSIFVTSLKGIVNTLSTMVFSIFALPLMFAVAIIIKLFEPKSSIIFKQKRVGKDAKEFVCYKFRTMKEDSEDILKDYLSKNPEEIEYYKKYRKYKNDPRVTKIGSFLRKTSLDELPQLFNILKLEMNLIGPRPYMKEEIPLLQDCKDTILYVKPGITGLWQVSGRSKTEFNTRLKIDKWYVNNWSLWLDFMILIKTFKVVIKQEGSI